MMNSKVEERPYEDGSSDCTSNKPSEIDPIRIKKAVEEIYKVKVKAVNTLIAPGKLRRVRYQLGRCPETKKAVVTLKSGSKIEVK